jgi:hypothetical protein
MMTSMTTATRTWQAAVIIEGEALPVDLTDVADLQADTVAAAAAAAASVLTRTWERLHVNTYKTTAAHGTAVPDRCWEVRWSPRTRRFVAEKNGCPIQTANPFA